MSILLLTKFDVLSLCIWLFFSVYILYIISEVLSLCIALMYNTSTFIVMNLKVTDGAIWPLTSCHAFNISNFFRNKNFPKL